MTESEATQPDALFSEQDSAIMAAKNPDTPERFTDVMQPINDKLSAYGRQFHKPFLPLVAFFLPSGNYLAHTRNLDTFLRALAAQKRPTIRAIVIVTGTADEQVAAMPADIYEFPVPLTAGWLTIQKLCYSMNVQAFVHVSNSQSIGFAAAIRCGQKHIWWSHKWHGLTVPGIDGYISATMGHAPAHWTRTFTALPDLLDRSRTHVAQKIRSHHSAKTIFGTLCREEKITLEYVHLVAQILAKTPDSMYVYAGRDKVEQLDALGAIFIGWVDTALWVQIIDVFLDTFPFHSGHTAFEAVAAGKPVVSMEPPLNCEQLFLPDLLRRCGIDPIVAKTAEEYVTNATTHATLCEMTRRQHAAYLNMQDPNRMAEDVSEKILEVINR